MGNRSSRRLPSRTERSSRTPASVGEAPERQSMGCRPYIIRCTSAGQKASRNAGCANRLVRPAVRHRPAIRGVSRILSRLLCRARGTAPHLNAFFDRVMRHESLAVTKIVGTVLRHTVGYQNHFGGRRTECPRSYSYLQSVTNIQDRTTLSGALRTSIDEGYIRSRGGWMFRPKSESTQGGNVCRPMA